MRALIIPLAALLLGAGLLSPLSSPARQGAAERNVFGPESHQAAPACRGACGQSCPSTCEQVVRFECSGSDSLLRVRSYSCGTHQGCRDHDACLDRCAVERAEGYDCQTECHARAVEDWGMEWAGSWALGGGPNDPDPLWFEYTMDAPAGAEAQYRCPDGATRQCGGDSAACMAANRPVEPVFDAYSGNGPGVVQVSGFRSGRVCLDGGQPASVCQPTADIQVTGSERCSQADGAQACSWYGFELDYRNANPLEPLNCHSTGADEDFLGGIVSQVIKAAPANTDTDLGNLLGNLQKELKSGKSLDQLFGGMSITTADGQVLGGAPPGPSYPEPGVPSEVVLDSGAGHVLVPMFELRNASPPGTTLVREVRCNQGGKPVIETTFRLHF
jgi:hypothetical protein